MIYWLRKLKIYNDIEKIYLMSFLWAMGTMMLIAVLPSFMSEVIKVTHFQIGIIEGIAIGLSFLVKIIVGVLSDFFRSRKTFIICGSIVTFVTKFIFALSESFALLFIGRSCDRFGKGIRGSPTDALLGDIVNRKNYGKAYGKRQSFSTAGAVVGSLLSMGLLYIYPSEYRRIFLCASIPGFFAVCLACSLHSPPKDKNKLGSFKKFIAFDLKKITHLPLGFWLILVMSFFLMLSRFSETFVLLQARSLGFSGIYLPTLMVCLDLCHSLVAWPFGCLADKYSRKSILLIGILFFVFTHYFFYLSQSFNHIIIGAALIGIHLGMTQGVLKAIIADCVPNNLKGTGFSLFYMISGIGIVCGNISAGYISETFEIKLIFLFGAACSAFASLFLLCYLLFNYRLSSLKKI
jgi:MFS family permease